MYRKVVIMKKSYRSFLNIADILFFTLIILIKVVSLNYALNLVNRNNILLLMGCFGSTLLISSVMCMFEVKRRIKYFIAVNLFISSILAVDIIYNRYFYDVTSIALIRQVKLVGEVSSSIRALMHLSDLLYFIDIVLIIPVFIMYKNKLGTKSEPHDRQRLRLMGLFLILGFIFSSISIKALMVSQPGILSTLYDKKWVVKEIGNINFHAIDCYNYIANNVLKKQKISDAEKNEIKAWYDQNSKEKSQEYNGIMNGKNLIVVQLEAFQSFVLNTKINGQEVTPNLNKLAKTSLVLDNLFGQTSWGGTSDAEFLSNVSLFPAREGAVYYQYAGNTYDSLVSNLNDKGYYTSVMHANRAGFWNRTNMYNSLGFQSYESDKDFVIDDIQGIGLSDESFFMQSVQKMKSYNKPFYTFLITLSSHFPYKDDKDKIKDILDVGSFEGKLMGDYLKSVKYTDEAVGKFIAELKKEGLWENSVVVFYGDHSAIPFEKSSEIGELLYNKSELTPLEWITLQKVVGMIHFPGGEIFGHMEIAAGQIDLYPTLANVFGIDADYALGKDLLNSKSGFVANRNGVWVEDNLIYLSNIDRVVDMKTHKEFSKEVYNENFVRARWLMKVSDATLDYDLIKNYIEKADP
jgi:lipoteichoic acid synthase